MDKAILAKLEAILFIYGEPLEVKKMAGILGLTESQIKENLSALEEELKRDERGLALVQDRNKYQLVTRREFSQILENITKKEFTESLSPATLETLSIIAYAGPITRADIEYIRGVNSSFIIRTLLMRGLVERESDPKRANAYVYKTSFELLRHLGLSKQEDIPDFKKYKELAMQLHQKIKEKTVGQNPEITDLNDENQEKN